MEKHMEEVIVKTGSISKGEKTFEQYVMTGVDGEDIFETHQEARQMVDTLYANDEEMRFYQIILNGEVLEQIYKLEKGKFAYKLEVKDANFKEVVTGTIKEDEDFPFFSFKLIEGKSNHRLGFEKADELSVTFNDFDTMKTYYENLKEQDNNDILVLAVFKEKEFELFEHEVNPVRMFNNIHTGFSSRYNF